MYEGSLLSTSSPAFIVCTFFDSGHSDWCELTPHCSSFFFFLRFICLLFWWVLVAVHGLSLVAESGGYSLLWCMDLSLWWLPLLWDTGSRCASFSSCGMWTRWVLVHGHVGSSQTRDLTSVPWISRENFNPWTTREALTVVFICISLIIRDSEHLFMCLLAIYCHLWRNVSLGLCPLLIFFFF